MARSCWPVRRHAPAIWVGNSNGTSGRVGVQHSSLSKLLGSNWNLEKSIATGTHNSKPLDHLERRLAAPAVKREAEEDWASGIIFAGNTAIPSEPNSQHNCGHTLSVAWGSGRVGGPTVRNFLLRCVGVARHESLSA